jgi:rhamnulose-1-phosphate aldolase/alcohol dehydrogenase
MRSRWDDGVAAACVDRLAPQCGEDLALRVYTSRLIGADPDLVLHGGGNTSLKTRRRDVLGRDIDVVCVKGSGWDLATIEPPGLPALDLAALRRLRALPALGDEDMVNELRRCLLSASSPNPSVETLLHAFLPDAFVDHTHADAALVFGNRPEGARELAELFGDEAGVLPWTMPGFPLAQAVAAWREAHPEAIGLVLHRHGVFSWGPDARTSYERMIAIVDRLERAIAERLRGRRTILDLAPATGETDARRTALAAMPLLRRLLAESTGDALRPEQPWIVEWRPTREALAAAAAPGAAELFATAPLTPDHVLRTKGPYVVAEPDEEALALAVAEFAGRYQAYYASCAAGREPRPAPLDPWPRVVLVRGAGLFAWGKSKKDARIAADIAEHTIAGKARAQALSSYEALTDAELFEMEYWVLERAKLGQSVELPLARQVALVTGAAGAIGVAVARQLLERGAHVLVTDLPGEALDHALQALRAFGERVQAAALDVTSETSVAEAFETCVLAFGGVDVVVANAGVAHVASLATLALADWERVRAVNETGVFLTFRAAARWFEAQRLGGRLVLVASKNVPAPGADFVAYSASKAAAVQVARVAALELARLGVLVNVVHPDAVFADAKSGTSSGLWDAVGAERMRSRGQSPEALREHYRQRSLLGVEVTAEHVAEAVAFFAEGRTPTTGAALTVDGGLKETFYR